MPITPNVEDDLCRRAAQVAPAVVVVDGAGRNAWPGDEIPIEGGAPSAAYFFEYISTIQVDQWQDTHLLRITIRGNPRKRDEARGNAMALRNALHASGKIATGFVGFSGARYMDVRCTSLSSLGPDSSSDAPYFSIDCEVVQDG